MISGQRILNKLNDGLWQPIKTIFAANRDFPYHDFVSYDDGDEPVSYMVGQNNKDVRGDQQKHFVSKSTMVFSDVECTIRFNDSGNTPITIRANTQYEFLSSVRSIYVSVIGEGGYIDIGFEGVLPQETRSAE